MTGYSDTSRSPTPARKSSATEIKKDLIDESKAVDCVLQPNHCSIHHAKLIHGSNANTSSTPLRLHDALRPREQRLSAPSIRSRFQIYLARGQDKADNSYGDPTKPNERWISADRETRPKGKAARRLEFIWTIISGGWRTELPSEFDIVNSRRLALWMRAGCCIQGLGRFPHRNNQSAVCDQSVRYIWRR